MVGQVLLDVLKCLTEEKFEDFKFYLRQDDILPGRKPLQLADLEKANRTKTVDLMVQTYRRDGAKEVTKEVLRKINRNDLVETYSSALRGQSQEANVKMFTVEGPLV